MEDHPNEDLAKEDHPNQDQAKEELVREFFIITKMCLFFGILHTNMLFFVGFLLHGNTTMLVFCCMETLLEKPTLQCWFFAAWKHCMETLVFWYMHTQCSLVSR